MNRKALLVPSAMVLVFTVVTLTGTALATSPSTPARTIDPIISTQWLEDNINSPNLVLLDVREPDNYAVGHISGSINVPAPGNFFLCLLDPNCGLWMEVPPLDNLFSTIGHAGITTNSTVIVIARTVDMPALGPGEFGLTMAARVAVTLIYAGIENVAMLDGGYDKWAAEGRVTSTEPVFPTAIAYDGVADGTMFVTKDYVEDKIGKSILVDSRDADMYFGIKKDISSKRAGHIPTSKALPAPWFWTAAKDEAGVTTGITWKDTATINEIALTVLGKDKDEEIIVYCGVGGYASPVYYVLTEVMGCTNVKFYDGSMQEWTADPDALVTKYKYE